MTLYFACGDTKSLKTQMQNQFFFSTAAKKHDWRGWTQATNMLFVLFIHFWFPLPAYLQNLLSWTLCVPTLFPWNNLSDESLQALFSSSVPWCSQAVIGSCSWNSRPHNHHASLTHSRGPHARAQEQPSGKVTNNVAPTEKDKLAGPYSSLSASFQGWSQVTANLACICQQAHICISAKL